MQEKRNWVTGENLIFLGCIVSLAGLMTPFYAVMSAGTALIALPAIISRDWKNNFIAFYKNKPAFLISLIFLLHLLSVFYTENIPEWKRIILLKIPLVLIPFGISSAKNFSRNKFHWLLFLFVLLVFLISIGTTVNYFFNYEELNKEILKSTPIPIITKISHIYFSIMAAFAVFCGYYLVRKNFLAEKKMMKVSIVMMSIIILVSLHIIAARTGLAAFYFALFCFASVTLFAQKKFLTGTIVLILLVVAPFLAYQTSESFRNRILNTMEDLRRYRNNEYMEYWSISQRFEAWKMTWEVFKQHPVIGTGIADVNDEILKQYEKLSPKRFPENRIFSHNQFLLYLAGFGITGLLIFLFAFFYPLFSRKNITHPLFISLAAILFASFMVESVLERQHGITFFVLFWTLMLCQIESSESK